MKYQMSTNKIFDVIRELLEKGVISKDSARLILYEYCDRFIQHAQTKDAIKCPTCEQQVLPF